ncbi:hypothetical protein K438DRAFT_1753664 [Mycena galopus ATCC 62051]|nr:hypothetical protein K438DRAFT_1753664 [Mycena galopus ATCC 62051]
MHLILGLSKLPIHTSLLAAALAHDILRCTPPTIAPLYQVLEATFDLLSLCTEAAPILTSTVYVSVLIRHGAHRAMAASTTEGKEKKANHTFDPEAAESYIMGCARCKLAIRVDHTDSSIAFVDKPFSNVLDVPSPLASTFKEGQDGTIQPGVAELVCTRLGNVACCLYNVLEVIEPPSAATSISTPEEEQAAFVSLLTGVASALMLMFLSVMTGVVISSRMDGSAMSGAGERA